MSTIRTVLSKRSPRQEETRNIIHVRYQNCVVKEKSRQEQTRNIVHAHYQNCVAKESLAKNKLGMSSMSTIRIVSSKTSPRQEESRDIVHVHFQFQSHNVWDTRYCIVLSKRSTRHEANSGYLKQKEHETNVGLFFLVFLGRPSSIPKDAISSRQYGNAGNVEA